MVSINGNLLKRVIFVTVFILLFSTNAESRPLRSKRAVNEVQLMHNLGVHKHVELRQDWLQMKLRGIHTASVKNTDIIPELKELYPGEAEEIMAVLEKLMNPS
ncbi:parathyroid hormone 1a [Danio rerio]|uniref:Parathyroid hormone n=1 Tax=Danio rerio TaxID=7955 RepID=Q6WQ25_DANRE|nr:parathyroid hormone 1a [Danio rerio]AAQ16566.1 parathyroid hormone ligand type-1 [Danio rerio]|eukprot:NP_998115.1 parathyroid hormone 1a [Danio rerio]